MNSCGYNKRGDWFGRYMGTFGGGSEDLTTKQVKQLNNFIMILVSYPERYWHVEMFVS